MANQEDDDFQRAMKMSMQHESPEPKRSKPRENAGGAGSGEESPGFTNRKLQRELMAAAAEKRMMEARNAAPAAAAAAAAGPVSSASKVVERSGGDAEEQKCSGTAGAEMTKGVDSVEELSLVEANRLFWMVFGSEVTKDILVQWSNQGIRFSPDPETSMGLVQHEGGPCGVLATIQGFVIKYLLFCSEELGKVTPNVQQNLDPKGLPKIEHAASNGLASVTDDRKSRALIRSMSEILFSCGSNKIAVIATLNIPYNDIGGSDNNSKDEILAKALEGTLIESGFDLHKLLRVKTFTSQEGTLQRLEAMLPVFRSRLGALLFLISALLSRGLDSIQVDRDDPSQSLVTAPFGHASQEIVNLLLCGQAVANVFDGRMDLGGGMFVKGISTTVEVGFLTLLESLNFCKVGQYLKCPKWPIWVVGSESHYTVLFALDTSVQDENELEQREAQIRRAFDAQDQSGGGGFISVDGFHQVLRESSINLPAEKLDHLCSTGFIVWSEFWQVLLDLDKSSGGLKDSTGFMGKKVFDIYHFNGIAKSVLNGMPAPSIGETPLQRPRQTKLRVSVPPRWTPEEFMADVAVSSGPKYDTEKETGEVAKPEPSQHAPLVDCIRTRWPRASCNWEGDPPSIV